VNRKAGRVNRRVVVARDLGLWTGLSVVVLAESGARDDPF
jgi:hypothetical protein